MASRSIEKRRDTAESSQSHAPDHLQKTREWQYRVIKSAHQNIKDEFKFHPERHEPLWHEAKLRTITRRDTLPKATQSYDATERIIEKGGLILGMLRDSNHRVASSLDQKGYEGIGFLMNLANEVYNKSYRKKANARSRLD